MSGEVYSQEYRPKSLNEYGEYCFVDPTHGGGIEVHHANGDRSNQRLENLVPLCEECHNKVHFGEYDGGNQTIRWLRSRLPDDKIHGSGESPDEPESNFTRVHLNLCERHIEWARENNINLSAEVRDLLDERIQNR